MRHTRPSNSRNAPVCSLDHTNHLVEAVDFLARADAERGALVDGRSVVTSVPSTAVTLVLLRAGSEVLRTPITLSTGDVNTIAL